jgi:hypothetical protein
MSLGFYFATATFTPAQYDETIKKLDEAGAGSPAGRQYHVALESEGKIQVFDIWESQDQFEAFGSTLMPIMNGLGADPGAPMIAQVRNIIKG